MEGLVGGAREEILYSIVLLSHSGPVCVCVCVCV